MKQEELLLVLFGQYHTASSYIHTLLIATQDCQPELHTCSWLCGILTLVSVG